MQLYRSTSGDRHVATLLTMTTLIKFLYKVQNWLFFHYPAYIIIIYLNDIHATNKSAHVYLHGGGGVIFSE